MGRILLVEDESAIATTVEFALREDGFEVVHALTGRDALRLAAAQLAAERDAEADRVLGFEIGADDYVAKPFSPRELVARVRAVLRRARGAAPSGAFVHDAEGHRISWRGRALDLTRYEYGLLAALLQRPGAILSRAQLMDRVWGTDSDSTDRTVDTHIKTLRAKLREVDAEADPIRTQRGLGYSLHVD